MEAIPPASHDADKSSLRIEFRQARARFSESVGRSVHDSLENHVHRLARDLSVPGLQVALFRALPGEAGVVLSPENKFFYPRVNEERLEFFRPRGATDRTVRPGSLFTRSPLGIEEPDPSHADKWDASQPFLVFCPAVAVDRHGGRLGMGMGFYDRFFADHPSAIRAAVVYQVQLSKEPLRADSWDQSMDWIVTETMILRTSFRRSS